MCERWCVTKWRVKDGLRANPELLQEALRTAPATRQPAAAQRRPRAHQLLQKAPCILRLPHESQLRASGSHARTSSSRRLRVLRLPHES